MKAVLLAGGLGTRLSEETSLRDKLQLEELWQSGKAPWKSW
jgi:dTDP-glucose pyrophosphorylase